MEATVSTPAKPPPATATESNCRLSPTQHSLSAASRMAMRRLRSLIASERDFIVSALSSTPGRLKNWVVDPRAKTTCVKPISWQ
jgi:hypothetical protein